MVIVSGDDKSRSRGSEEGLGKEMVFCKKEEKKAEFAKVSVLDKREDKRTPR